MKLNYALDLDDYTLKNAFLWGNCVNHFRKAGTGTLGSRAVHVLIALVELLPIISQIASIFEMVIVTKCVPQSLLPQPRGPSAPKDSSSAQDPSLKKKEIPCVNDVYTYPGDITKLEKANIHGKFTDDNIFSIIFWKAANINLTIRRQDIFGSGAQVIVNAANTHLGGGTGIDGAIHKAGGSKYAQAHKELQTAYNSNYVEGYAAMIDSGALKEKHNIDNVIVVAGPQGDSTVEKERQLYSCYYNSLCLANSQKKKSIAFPSISTGIFAFPLDRAAAISLSAINQFLKAYPKTSVTTISIHFLPKEPKDRLETYQEALA